MTDAMTIWDEEASLVRTRRTPSSDALELWEQIARPASATMMEKRLERSSELTPEERAQIISTVEPRGFFAEIAAQTTIGKAARAFERWRSPSDIPYVEPPSRDFGTLGNLAVEVGSVASDPLFISGAGPVARGAGAVIRGGSRAAEIARRSAAGAALLGGVSAIHDPLERYRETGQASASEAALAGLRGAAVGAALGPASMAGRAAIPAEIVAMTGVGAAVEGRVPTVDDLAHAAGIVLGLRAIHAAGRMPEWIRGLRSAKSATEARKIIEENVGKEKADAIQREAERIRADREAGSAEPPPLEKTTAQPVEPLKPGEVEIPARPTIPSELIGKIPEDVHIRLTEVAPEAKAAMVRDSAQRELAGQQDPVPNAKTFREATGLDVTRKVRAAIIEIWKREQKNAESQIHDLRKDQGGDAGKRSSVAPGEDARGENRPYDERAGPAVETQGRTQEITSPPRARVTESNPLSAIPRPITLNDLAQGSRRLMRGARWLLKQFTSQGELPKEVFDARVASEGEYLRTVKHAEFAMQDLKTAIRKDFGSGPLSPTGQALIDGALRGDRASLSQLPEQTRGAVNTARAIVDGLMRRIRETVPMSDAMEAAFDANQGIYLRRTYQAHRDPQWAEKVPQWVRDQFKQALIDDFMARDAGRSEKRAPPSTEQLEHTVRAILQDASEAANPIAFLAGSRLGSKDLSGFIRRKELSDAFRALLGEEKDPFVNLARTITYQARLLANQKFLTQVRDAGMGRYFWRKDDPRIDPRASAMIASPTSAAMNPLNGLYTYPEIAREFRRYYDPRIGATVPGRWYYRALLFAKTGKTVFSHASQIRNLISNVKILIQNGVFELWKVRDPIRAIAADLGLNRSERARALYEKWASHGILDQSASLQEMMTLVRGASGRELSAELGGPNVGAVRSLGKFAGKTWQAADNLYKIFQAETEARRYARAKPEWTQREVEARAAQIVRNTQPTAIMVPRAVRVAQKLPIIETFITFKAERIRNKFNLLRLIAEELRDPSTAGIGMTRVLGIIASASAVPSLAYLYSALYGVNQENTDDVAALIYDFQRNAPLIMLSNPKDGKLEYVDLSFSDPDQEMTNIVTALLRGDDWKDGFWRAMAEATDMFLGENLIMQLAGDLLRGQNKEGAPIWNEADSTLKKIAKAAQRAEKTFRFGSVESIIRLIKAHEGKIEPSGRSYDPRLEWISQFGIRVQGLDVRQRLAQRAARYSELTESAMRDLRRMITQRGPVDMGALASERESAEIERRRVFDSMAEDIQRALRLGLSVENVRDALKAGGLSQKTAMNLIRGQYIPWKPSPATEEAFRRKMRGIPIEGTANLPEYRRRKEAVR